MHVITFCRKSIARVFIRYPEARAIQRKVVFHAGPTNSGKTYHAIQRYLAAKSGVYCGPLKLLAHEIFEKSNTAVCAGFSLSCSVIKKFSGSAASSLHFKSDSGQVVQCSVFSHLTECVIISIPSSWVLKILEVF